MEILSSTESQELPTAPASEPSQQASTAEAPETRVMDAADDRETVKALLAEARQTKVVLEDFETAVKNAEYPGHQTIVLAKGLSFLSAIINQHKAHIFNLQQKLEKPAEKPKEAVH